MFCVQIVYVWQKNLTVKSMPNTVLFLRRLAAKQHVCLDIVGKKISL